VLPGVAWWFLKLEIVSLEPPGDTC